MAPTISRCFWKYVFPNAAFSAELFFDDGVSASLYCSFVNFRQQWVNVSGTNNYGGLLSLGAATTISSDSGTLNLTNTGTITGATFGLTLTGSGSGSISSIIGITTGSLTKSGSGTWTLAGVNTYTGTTTVSGGTLQAGVASVANISGAFGNNSAVTLSGTAVLDITTFNTQIGSLTGGGTTGVTLGGATLSVGGDNTSPAAYAGVIAGAGALTKIGTGTLTLSGDNSYAGLTTINAGTLKLGANGGGTSTPLGTAAAGTVVSNGATFDLNGFTLGTAEALTLNGTGVSNGGALTNSAAGASTYSGLIALGSDSSIVAGNGNIVISNPGTITGAGFGLTLGGTNAASSIASIIGTTTGSLIKAGSGTWTLSGTNTYTGVTEVDAGVFKLSGGTAIADTGVVKLANGATLDLTGSSETVGLLSNNTSGGTVTSSAGGAVTVTTGVEANSTFAGVIQDGSGTVALTKQGTGAFTLTGVNTYAGTTTINNGTLIAANANALGSTAGGTTVANGGTLQISNVSIGAEAVTLNGAGVGSAGALVGTGTASLAGVVTLASNASIGATAVSDALTLGGAVDGAFALTQTGLGTVTYSSAIGSGTPLASLTTNAGSTSVINGGAVTTTGTQTYGGAVTLGNPTVLTTTNSDITATNAVSAGGNTLTLAAGAGNVSFANPGNNFGSVMITSANDVTLNDVNAIQFSGASSIGGVLNVTAVGISEAGGASLTVTGQSTFNAGAGPITLTAAGNNFTGAVSLTNSGANDVAITDTNAIVLGISNVGSGLFTVNAGGTITQTGPITQASGAGAASFTSTSNSVINLTNAGNDFTGAVSATNTGGSDISITDVNALALGTVSTGGGDLFLVANGAITQSGALLVGGKTAITAGAANDITLTDTANVFTGEMRIVSGNNVTLNDTATTFKWGNGGASTISGNLVLTTGGPVTQNQALLVGGTSTINAGNDVITLTNAGNDFTGAVSAINTGTSDISITDANALVLGTVSPGTGDLFLVANGAITQTAPLLVGGRTRITAGAANDVTLGNPANQLTGQVRIVSGNNVTLSNSTAFTFGFGGASSVSGNLSLTAAGPVAQANSLNVTGTTSINAGANAITLDDGNNHFTGAVSLTNSGANDVLIKNDLATVLGASSVGSGMLTVQASGASSITQTGAITQAPAATGASFKTGGAPIVLTHAGNDFTGPVSAINSGAADISITDANALALAKVDTGGGDLFLIANGAITQSGLLAEPILVGGKTSITAGTANDITLTNGNNAFTGELRIVSGNNVTLNDGAATFKWGNGGTSTISGNLVLTTGGPVTQTQALVVAGTTTINAGNDVIALTNPGNDFTGAVSANNTGASDISITDANALVLGATSPGTGDLFLVANGPIVQTAALTVGGKTSITAGANDVTLSDPANQLTGQVRIVSGKNVTLNNNTAFAFGNGGTSAVSGNLSLTAAGPVTQANALTVDGTTTINAGANPITLTTAGNNFTGAVSLTNSGANDVAITDTNAIVLGTSNVGSGLFTVNAGGTITQTGPITQALGAGAVSFGTGASPIALTNPGNDFTGAVSLSNSGANDASIKDVNALTLAASAVGGNLSAVAGGRLMLAGTLTTGGSTGTSIELVGQGFTNSAGAGALAPGAGSRFLVWSSNPDPFGAGTPDDRGGLAYDFKQYNATYGVTPVLGSGNGFLYTLAPTLTPVLQGTVTKPYDGLNAATLAAGNYKTTGIGEVDSDTVVLSNSATGAYASAHAGSGILVTAGSASTITSATNGTATVYGYQVSSSPASGSVGTIDPRALTGTATITPVAKTYDGSTAASGSSISGTTSGTVNGDTVALSTGSYVLDHSSTHAGATTITATGNAALGAITSNPAGAQDGSAGNPVAALAGDYTLTLPATITNQNVASSITPALVTATLTNTGVTKVYDGATGSAASASYSVAGQLGTDTVSVSTGALNYNTSHVVGSDHLIASGLTVGGVTGSTFASASLASDYQLTAATANGAAASAAITPAPLVVLANNASKTYGQTVTFNGTEFAASGLVTGEAIGTVVLASAGAGANANVVGSPYVIVPSAATGGTFSAGNYTITYNNGTLTVTLAPLTITANDASRPVSQSNPSFTASYAGFQASDTPAALGGSLAFTTPGTIASPPGAYAITPFGQTSTNYTITHVNGTLTVIPAGGPTPPLAGLVTPFVNPVIQAVNYLAPDPYIVAYGTGESVTSLEDEAGSLNALPPTAAGPTNGATLAPPPGDQATRRPQENWLCFRYGSFTIRRCR